MMEAVCVGAVVGLTNQGSWRDASEVIARLPTEDTVGAVGGDGRAGVFISRRISPLLGRRR